MLRPIEMHKMSGVLQHDYFDSRGMDQTIAEEFAILGTRPEVSFGGKNQRRGSNQRRIPQLAADGEIETIFHRSTRRSKTGWRTTVAGTVACQRRFGEGLCH